MSEFHDELRAVFAKHYPDFRMAKIVLTLPPDLDTKLRVFPNGNYRGASDDNVPAMARNILDALEESNGPLTGEELAKAAGYEHSGAFKRMLARLLEEKLIVNKSPGYTLSSRCK